MKTLSNSVTFNKVCAGVNSLRNALPHACLLCLQQTTHYKQHLCNTCRADLPFSQYLCLGCACPLTQGNYFCGKCQQSPPAHLLVTACSYQTPIKELIAALKYRNNTLIAHEVAHLLNRRVVQLLMANKIPKPDYLVPVPLHWKKYYQRGFNQASLITRCLSQTLSIPMLDCCQRTRDTTAQASLSFSQRQHNLDEAFTITKPIVGKTIALVDDVFTTGSTLHELAATFKQTKDINIQFWTIARTQLE